MTTPDPANGVISTDITQVLDSLPFYVMLVDGRHHIIYANLAVRDQFGLKPAEIINQYCPMVIHGSKGPVPECPLEECIEHGDVAVEREHYDANNDRWLSSAIYPTALASPTGEKVYFHMVRDISVRRQAEAELQTSLERLRKTTASVIRALTITVEKRDPYTAGHQQQVSKLAQDIALQMGLSQLVINGVLTAGLVHDIGKVAVPAEILSKPGKISQHEYHIIQTHPEVSFEILSEIEFPWPVAEIVLQHHERINGSGYPKGLKEEEILLEAKILAVADVIDAMTSHRPYRQALGLDAALKEIMANSGTLYDPDVVKACVALLQPGV